MRKFPGDECGGWYDICCWSSRCHCLLVKERLNQGITPALHTAPKFLLGRTENGTGRIYVTWLYALELQLLDILEVNGYTCS